MIKNVVAVLSLTSFLVACGGETNVKPDGEESTASAANTFEALVDSYASSDDKGDGMVYKFTSYSKIMETYHTGARYGRFTRWCSQHNYKFDRNGDMALSQQLNKAYPGEVIRDQVICGDGQGGFYGFAVFPNRNATAYVKAGTLNPAVKIDFWPVDGKPSDFWPDAKAK